MEVVCMENRKKIHDAIQSVGAKPEIDMKGVYSLVRDPYFDIIIVNKERSYMSITVTRTLENDDLNIERLNNLNTDPTMGTHSVIQNAYLYRQIQYFDETGIGTEEINHILSECHINADKGYRYLSFRIDKSL